MPEARGRSLLREAPQLEIRSVTSSGTHGGGNAIGQVDNLFSTVARDDALMLTVVVGVHIDVAGENRLALDVKELSTVRRTGPNARNAAVFSNDRSGLDCSLGTHRHEVGSAKCNASRCPVAWDLEFDFEAVGLPRFQVVPEVSVSAAKLDDLISPPAREEASGSAEGSDGK